MTTHVALAVWYVWIGMLHAHARRSSRPQSCKRCRRIYSSRLRAHSKHRHSDHNNKERISVHRSTQTKQKQQDRQCDLPQLPSVADD
eukprot:COSAG06_NODE_4570_length_4137_cov_1.758791_6_plen_87_part_00